MDEILQFVSHDTGLPIKHKVKKKLITRDQVERYVEKHIKSDKDVQRIERSQLVLRKFGMIPQNYDLHAEFLKLLREQVAAFYDPKTKTVNLLDWVQPELQKPVLAHELTHALQDQAIDLRTWFRAGGSDDGSVAGPAGTSRPGGAVGTRKRRRGTGDADHDRLHPGAIRLEHLEGP